MAISSKWLSSEDHLYMEQTDAPKWSPPAMYSSLSPAIADTAHCKVNSAFYPSEPRLQYPPQPQLSFGPFVHEANRCSKVIATSYVQLIISCNSIHCTLQGQLSLLSLRARSAVPLSATATFWLIWNNAAWWPIVREYTKSHNRHENSAIVNQYLHHQQCVVVNL